MSTSGTGENNGASKNDNKKDQVEEDEEDLFAAEEEEQKSTIKANNEDGANKVESPAKTPAGATSPPKENNKSDSIPRKQHQNNKSGTGTSNKLLPDPTTCNADSTITAKKLGLPEGVKVPPSVTQDILNGTSLETLKSLPVTSINDALVEYDDAVKMKGASIKNRGAYLYGVIKRYAVVQDRAGKGILPMGAELTPLVRERLRRLFSSGFCSEGTCVCI